MCASTFCLCGAGDGTCILADCVTFPCPSFHSLDSVLWWIKDWNFAIFFWCLWFGIMPKGSQSTQCHGALPAPCFLCSLGSLIWSEFIFVLVVTWPYGRCYWGIVHYRLNVNDFRYAPTGAWKSLRPMGKWEGWETYVDSYRQATVPPPGSYSPPPQHGRRTSVHTFSLSKGPHSVSWRILRSLLGAAAGSLRHTSKTFFCH